MQKKCENVGIISMYHGSRNYGGLLQCYALCKYLSSIGVEAKQIDLPSVSQMLNIRERVLSYDFLTIVKKVFRKLRFVVINFYNRTFHKEMQTRIELRNNSIDQFRETMIPHIGVFDTNEELNKYNSFFDCFVCGSDQIWNPYAFRDEYFLKFADDSKLKIAYAASIAKGNIDRNIGERLAQSVRNIDVISVRENMSREILHQYGIEDVEVVLDPVFLLSKEQWEKQIEDIHRDKEYVFYYMLEGNYSSFIKAKAFARKNNLDIVAIPGVSDSNLFVDAIGRFKRCYGNTPFDFIRLIKNARFVITDSFHASAFSCIFEKEVFFVECKQTKTLFPRIEVILEALDCKDHYCESFSLEKISELPCIDYLNHNKKLDFLINHSKEFIGSSLGKNNG